MARAFPLLKVCLILLAFAAISTSQGLLCAAQELENEAAFPSVELDPLYGGEAAALLSEGQITYVDLWASWCGPCAKTLPELKTLAQTYDTDEVQFVMVSVDEDPDKARAFAHRLGVKDNQFSDPDGSLMADLQVPGLPAGFLVDANGEIRLVHLGGQPGATEFLKARIDRLLSEQRFAALMNNNGEIQ